MFIACAFELYLQRCDAIYFAGGRPLPSSSRHHVSCAEHHSADVHRQLQCAVTMTAKAPSLANKYKKQYSAYTTDTPERLWTDALRQHLHLALEPQPPITHYPLSALPGRKAKFTLRSRDRNNIVQWIQSPSPSPSSWRQHQQKPW